MLSDLEALLIKHEGMVLKPYRCPTGHLSIGVGHNLEAHPLPDHIQSYLDENGSITEEMAFELLREDIGRTKSDAEVFEWFPALTEVRQNVVLDMIFNMGLPKFEEFKKTIELIARGDFQNASVEMVNSKWASQVKGRSSELAKMMRQG